ncbi:MAG: hypothetical protein V3T86_09560 [Planctomycetota bacterium]
MADRSDLQRRIVMGVGLDGDGHARVTRGEDFVILGGSEGTHHHMQDGVLKFQETLRKMGTDQHSASNEQMEEAARESGLA